MVPNQMCLTRNKKEITIVYDKLFSLTIFFCGFCHTFYILFKTMFQPFLLYKIKITICYTHLQYKTDMSVQHLRFKILKLVEFFCLFIF